MLNSRTLLGLALLCLEQPAAYAGVLPITKSTVAQVRQEWEVKRFGGTFRVEGTVTAVPGTFTVADAFYVEDETAGISVRSGTPLDLALGDRVVLEGHLTAIEDIEPELERAVIIQRSHGPPPKPTPITASLAFGKGYLGRFITLDGEVKSTSVGETRDGVIVQKGAAVLAVYIRRRISDPAIIPSAAPPGSKVEVSGILMPGEFAGNTLRLRTAGDLHVVGHPGVIPWRWILLLLAVLAGSVLWAISLRRMVRVKTRETAEHLASAQEASRLKTEFLANVSHEIRTPLHGILGLQDLLMGTELSAEQREWLKWAQESSRQLLTLLNDFLDISRIEADKLALQTACLDPGAVARAALRTMGARAGEKGIGVDLVAPDGLQLVLGDRDRIQQVLLNLLSNAIKFTEKGKVTLEVSAEDSTEGHSTVCYRVIDTGIGIPEDKRRLVFEAFRQVDGSITRKYGGSGLGLAIASRLVDRMGGTIELQSELGRGSVFTVRLPLPLARIEPGPEFSMPEAKELGAEKLRILVAEDNAVNRRLIHRLLEKGGHEVHAVSDGLAALNRATKECFDLILMDVQMPVMDGLKATERIRAIESGRRTPIVAMTAHAYEAEHARCLASGIDAVLTKPFDPSDLDRILRLAL